MMPDSPTMPDGRIFPPDLIPPSLIEPPTTNDRRGILRDEAAALLNHHLRRLARMGNPLELRISRLLGRMKRLSAFLDLGFVRMTDYAVERLGLSSRRTQVLIQLDEGLRRLPATTRAFEAGHLSHTQVLLLLRIATPETEAAWIDKAATMNVRKFEKEVRRAGTTTEREPPGAAADEEAPLAHISFPAPDRLRGQWDWAVEVFRRTAGAAAPIWQAAEGFAAEYLSGLPGLPTDALASTDEAPPLADARSVSEEPCDAPNAADLSQSAGPPESANPLEQPNDDEGIELFEELQRALEDELGIARYGPSPIEDEENLPTDLDLPDDEPETPGDAAALDHRLRCLIDLRQNLAWHQGRLLRTFANYHLYRALGFASLSRYCRENLGMSVRRARSLIALERRLIELPHLERAYREGALSWVKASEIARVAQTETEQAWIHLGRSITARRLRDEIALALTDIENEALPWNARCGLPRGLTSDGRVQLSAPSSQPPSDPCPGSDDGVQTSAQAVDHPIGSGVQTSAPSNRIATRIRFRAPADVAQLWRQALSACRTVNGEHLQEWECVAHLLRSFRRTWDLRGSDAWLRRYAVFERDGWRCRVPGCTSRRNLHAHHVVFRSRGGGDETDNLVSICATHHHRCLHAGTLHCYRLPDNLLAWVFGTTAGEATGAAPEAASGATPGARADTARERSHIATGNGSASPNLRFVEDVVWEVARNTVRST